jgi:superfamily II DNA/RNA helicase
MSTNVMPQPIAQTNKQPNINAPLENFSSFDIPESLILALKDMGISHPTPIQEATISLAVEGRDIMASAQTGSGKTLAYVLPMMARLLASPSSKALVLTPTRELAVQVRDIIRKLLGNKPSTNVALIIGGESMGKQFAQLRVNPRIIVGTPGRIYDHLGRGNLSLKAIEFLAIDETDRMLDMGFSIQLDKIATYLPKERQTLMFSATIPSNILKLSEKYLREPTRICVDAPTKAAPKIKQEVIRTSSSEKYPNLIRELNERDGSVIIFVKTKRGADRLADKLRRQDLSADSIHGDLKQRQRDRAIMHFRNNKTRIMVATDIAARGLDIPHIRHVINYDLPQCPEDYIHRIGRTARAGLEGNALCLICPEDNAKWNAISRLMNPGSPNGPANQGRQSPNRKSSKGRSHSSNAHFQGSNKDREDSPFKKRSSKKRPQKAWQQKRKDPSGKSGGQSTGQFSPQFKKKKRK